MARQIGKRKHRLVPMRHSELGFIKLAPGQVARKCGCGTMWITTSDAEARRLHAEHLKELARPKADA